MKLFGKRPKNFDGLVLTTIILIVLGCKCDGNFLEQLKGGGQKSNSESNSTLNNGGGVNSRPGNAIDETDSTNSGGVNTSPFPDSNATGDQPAVPGNLMDRLPISVGTSDRKKADKGDPKVEGFGNANDLVLGEYSVNGKTVSFAVAEYGSAVDAEKMLEKQLKDLKKQGVKVSEIGTAVSNSGQEVGISAQAEGKGNLVVLWTNDKFLHLAFGPKRATERFFADYDVP